MGQTILFLGSVGSGKGTQSNWLKLYLQSKGHTVARICSSEMLSEEKKKKSEIGLIAIELDKKGLLTPDERMNPFVYERFLEASRHAEYVLFDGFPRTVPQGEYFAERTAGARTIDTVLHLTVGDEAVIERMNLRLYCNECKASYHPETNPSSKGNLCESGHVLVRRDFDMPELIKARLMVYHAETEPLVPFYRQKGVLHDIDASLKPRDVEIAIRQVLKLEDIN